MNAEIEVSLSEAVKAVQERIPALSIPRDFSVGFGAEVEEQAKAFNQLQLMLILALILTYAVMASQYESLKDPFIIMFSVPLAAIGVVGALLLTGTTFSLQAYIGVIMLAGIVVSNAILLVDYTNMLRRRDGLPLREAVELAGRTRLRPILMTSLTTMLGLVPMALAIGEGSEIQAPLARVVIGGLVTSTVITLVFVPTVYTLFEEGWSGLRRGVHHEAPPSQSGDETMKKFIITLIVLGAIAGSAGAYYKYRTPAEEVKISTLAVARGDIIESVGATGTLQAVTTVQVGSQVSGNIKALYADFNSIVKKGQIVAELDPSLLQTQIEQARANLIRSQADLDRLKVSLDDARIKLKRTESLAARKLVSPQDLETAQVAVRSAEAQIKSSEASLSQSKASLNQNEVNLQHTVIEAPIDGIVISRNVDVGQTVAASMNAPTLFIIAEDLTKMQVNANVDESDVGRIRAGQVVKFRVDAYPLEEFTGAVSQVRLQPIVTQNVVTYATVIDVPNAQLKLKPGMTAKVTIEIARRNDVVRVPNAALRFRPNADTFAALNQPVPPEMQRGAGGGRMGGPGGSAPRRQAARPVPPRQPRPLLRNRPRPAPPRLPPGAGGTRAAGPAGSRPEHRQPQPQGASPRGRPGRRRAVSAALAARTWTRPSASADSRSGWPACRPKSARSSRRACASAAWTRTIPAPAGAEDSARGAPGRARCGPPARPGASRPRAAPARRRSTSCSVPCRWPKRPAASGSTRTASSSRCGCGWASPTAPTPNCCPANCSPARNW